MPFPEGYETSILSSRGYTLQLSTKEEKKDLFLEISFTIKEAAKWEEMEETRSVLERN